MRLCTSSQVIHAPPPGCLAQNFLLPQQQLTSAITQQLWTSLRNLPRAKNNPFNEMGISTSMMFQHIHYQILTHPSRPQLTLPRPIAFVRIVPRSIFGLSSLPNMPRSILGLHRVGHRKTATFATSFPAVVGYGGQSLLAQPGAGCCVIGVLQQ